MLECGRGQPTCRVYLFNLQVGFGVQEALKSLGNGCGIHVHQFEVQTDPHSFIFEDPPFGSIAIVFDGLMLRSEGLEML